jgi:hypothetical protein
LLDTLWRLQIHGYPCMNMETIHQNKRLKSELNTNIYFLPFNIYIYIYICVCVCVCVINLYKLLQKLLTCIISFLFNNLYMIFFIMYLI